MTPVERYHADLRAIGCVMCLRTFGRKDVPPAIHHCGDPSQRSDWYVVPLCRECHQGSGGYHGLGGERGFRARYKVGEAELLTWTTEEYVRRRG